MDPIHIVLTTLVNLFVMVSITSPNEHQEMGLVEGDRIYSPLAEKDRKLIPLARTSAFMILCVATMNYVYNHFDTPFRYYDYVLFLVIFIGWFLRMWAIRSLGHMFTFVIGIRKKHELVETGPYAILVHPGYAAQIMICITSLIFLKVHTLLVLAIGIYTISQIIKRMIIEEEMLLKEFGKKYQEILNNKYRLIPYIY